MDRPTGQARELSAWMQDLFLTPYDSIWFYGIQAARPPNKGNRLFWRPFVYLKDVPPQAQPGQLGSHLHCEHSSPAPLAFSHFADRPRGSPNPSPSFSKHSHASSPRAPRPQRPAKPFRGLSQARQCWRAIRPVSEEPSAEANNVSATCGPLQAAAGGAVSQARLRRLN